MVFLNLFRHEMGGAFFRLVVMAGLAGISNAVILASVNAAAQTGKDGKPGLALGMLFVISLLLFMTAGRFLVIAAVGEIEALIHRLRVRLMDYVRHSELLGLEEIGRARIYAAVVGQTDSLRQATTSLAFTMQGAILVIVVAIYIAWTSLAAFALSVLVIGLATAIYFVKSRQLAGDLQAAAEWQNRLFGRLTDLLDGFKEVRLNAARSDDLYDDIVEVSRNAANTNIRTQAETFKRLVSSQSSMYVLLGAVVFLAPIFSSVADGSIAKITMAVLFVIGACFGLVQAVPVIQAASAAAEDFEKLESQLRGLAAEELRGLAAGKTGFVEQKSSFDAIEIRGMLFHYLDRKFETPFQIGPLDFSLHKGELVYITGGNGSGKSTFLKVLAGLYAPDAGEIKLDGKLITNETRNVHRSLFSAIFFDYHLFQRLYGVPEPDPAEVERELARFKLTGKTELVDGEFRTLHLSTGQRKRLALIVSLLEKRQILLLDEWAADQDPEYRRKFYYELLPELHRAGVTVVLVTHDDRYLEKIDLIGRRLRMEDGRFVDGHAPERNG
jgi:putative ATP-binding cassette transporter